MKNYARVILYTENNMFYISISKFSTNKILRKDPFETQKIMLYKYFIMKTMVNQIICKILVENQRLL